jgi:hypothetical protein
VKDLRRARTTGALGGAAYAAAALVDRAHVSSGLYHSARTWPGVRSAVANLSVFLWCVTLQPSVCSLWGMCCAVLCGLLQLTGRAVRSAGALPYYLMRMCLHADSFFLNNHF